MNNHTSPEELAIRLKSEGKTFTEIARAIGVSRETIKELFYMQCEFDYASWEWGFMIRRPSKETDQDIFERGKIQAEKAFLDNIALRDKTEDENLRFRINSDLMDRFGAAKLSRREVEVKDYKQEFIDKLTEERTAAAVEFCMMYFGEDMFDGLEIEKTAADYFSQK